MEFHLRSIGQPCRITFTTSVWKLTTGLWISRRWLPCWKYLKMPVMFHCNIILMIMRMHLLKNPATYSISIYIIYMCVCVCSTDLWYILRLMLETSTITVNPLASQQILHVDVVHKRQITLCMLEFTVGWIQSCTFVVTYVPRVYDAQYTEICARHPYHQYTTH